MFYVIDDGQTLNIVAVNDDDFMLRSKSVPVCFTSLVMSVLLGP
jgi:hypothetical protein